MIEIDFKDISALIIGILSHGDTCDRVLAKDYMYQVNDFILNPLLNGNPSLEDVPIFKFVQACKGSTSAFRPANIGVDGSNEGGVTTWSTSLKTQPTQYLRLDSTFEGFTSIRIANMGTPFIHALCAAIREKGDEKGLRDIVQETKIKLKKFVDELNEKFKDDG